MSTRLIVKNLAPTVDEKELTKVFSQKGELTQVKVVRKKNGVSRKFGFIGFRTSDSANEALAYFNSTFIGSSKVTIEFAKGLNDSTLQSSKSKRRRGELDSQNHGYSEEGDNNSETHQVVEVKSKKRRRHEITKDEFLASFEGEPQEDEDGEENKEPTKNETMGKKAKLGDGGYFDDKVVDFSSDEEDGEESMEREEKWEREEGEDEKDEGRVFVRNLPFSVEEEDIKDYFSRVGPVSEVHLPLDGSGRKKGFGFVRFMIEEDGKKAIKQCDGTDLGGRIIHVMLSKKQKQGGIRDFPGGGGGGMGETNESGDGSTFILKTNYAKEREEQRKLMAEKQRIGWHASHVRSEAAVSSLARSLNVSEGEVMDPHSSDMALRMAVGETELQAQNYNFFATEAGVDLKALESGNISKDISEDTVEEVRRSRNSFLIKNLPFDGTHEDELLEIFSRYGDIIRILLPPSKSIALLEFREPSHARVAFKKMAYRRFKSTPLYLEWAPLLASAPDPSSSSSSEKESVEKKKNPKKKKIQKEDDQASTKKKKGSITTVMSSNSMDMKSTTLYVSNLSFETSDDRLRQFIEQILNITPSSVKIIRHRQTGDSRGFGFIEFESLEDAEKGKEELERKMLDGHALAVKYSTKKLDTPSTNQTPTSIAMTQQGEEEQQDGEMEGVGSTKIVVKNLSFACKKREIRELFSTYAQLKSVRLPKKANGKHRGFAFVDCVSHGEAKKAFEALSNAHLYGRHLVLQWSEEEERGGSEELAVLRKKASKEVERMKEEEAFGSKVDRMEMDDEDGENF